MEVNCAICTISYSSDQNISVTFCGHVFHGECISRWLRVCGPRKTCPQCRAQLNDSQVVPKIYMNINKQKNKLKERNVMIKERDVLKKDMDVLKKERDLMKKDRDVLKKAYETRTKERDVLIKERDVLKKDMDVLKKEKDLMKKDRDVLKKAHETRTKERDVLIKERDVLKKDMDVLKKEKDLMKKDSDVLKKAHETFRFKWNNRESVGGKYAITVKKVLLKMVAQIHGSPVDFLDQSDLATSLNPPSHSQVVKGLRKAKAIPSHSEKRTSTKARLAGQGSPASGTSQVSSKRTRKLPDGATKTSAKKPRLLSPALNSSKPWDA